MSQYKSAIRAKQSPDPNENSKYRSQARQLQELFPSWSNDDLQSLLTEVGGDVEVAATRISDGVAEQWGSVSRKKDKKAPSSAHASKESFPGRGDLRGARGGRGGRGGPGRGGAAAVRSRGGPPRGGAVNGRSPRIESPNPAHVDGTSSTPSAAEPKDGSDSVDASTIPVVQEPTTHQNGAVPSAGWTESSSSHLDTPVLSASSSWGATSTTSTWGGDTDANASTASVTAPAAKAPTKPATSKLSWAQIARPHEKPTPPPPAPIAPAPSHPPPATAPSTAPAPPAPEPEAEPEEPTTAQAPTWDDEPQTKLSVPEPEQGKPEQPESRATPQQHEAEPEVKEPPSPEPKQEQQLPASKSEPAPPPTLATPVLAQPAAATPSPKLSGRPAAATHRSSARYKNIDQPVVMPSSFGTGIEKVGMTFGSLSLGGESLLDSNIPEPEAPVAAPEPPSPPTPQTQAPAPQELPPPPPPATAPASTTLGSTLFSQQQALPQQAQPAPPQPSTVLHGLPPSVPQPGQQQPQVPSASHAAAAAAAVASPIQQYAQQHQQAQQHLQPQHHQVQHQPQQPSLASIHQQQLHQQQLAQQHPQHTPQSHNQYAQHGLPTHIDPSQQAQSQQQQAAATHSNYFGRGEAATAAPYYHAPTPPAAQAQDSPYGSFGQLGAQAQHQQGSHLGGFGSQDYGYADSQRGFYDSYQPSGFGNRNVLEDVKGLPGTQQQQPPSAGIPPSTAQTSQPHASLQGVGQPQPAGTQPPQQGYPVPYPYYSYPQSQQFYGYGPNYAAVPQAYKYPTAMYQPPPGPGSAPSPVTKQPGAGVGVSVQPQSNPYSQGLYPQGGYDDYPHHTQQHTHTLGLGAAAGEYGKQLYGAGAGQGFMGLGGQGAGGAGPASNAGGPRGAGSPDTPYKPYAPKDVGGVAAGRGAGQQQGQVQPQPQGQGQGGQGPQGQGGFYGGARFGGGGAGGVGGGGGVGGQQSAHLPQGGPHPGYPQGGNEGNFYQYRGQQQGYWQ
ncbi:hypothetical protein Hypma_009226 [Hypsizygus marmoreus]|uniref:RNA polymerase II degradation factor 1 n=1 Tax=Hypsizygus marmoreus TaxID=39966 RepID=A0A369JR94_HYPMA|nr:hypothetical protein Hypma_009226 [Hypsizygus marmoreus]